MITPTYFRYQFVRLDDCVSKAIAWFSAGHFSHVDIVLDDGRLLGARSDGGVQIRAAGYRKWTKCVAIDIPCTQAQKDTAIAFASAEIGKPYDHLAIWGFVLNRSWRDTEAWFCSELAAQSGEQAAFWPHLYSPVNHITPAAFALVCSAVPGRVITTLK